MCKKKVQLIQNVKKNASAISAVDINSCGGACSSVWGEKR